MMPLKNLPMNEIARLYASGKTRSELARLYGTNKDTISTRLVRHGVSLRPQRRVFCLETARLLYEQGNTCEQIAKKLKVTEWAINRGLKDSGVTMRDNYHPARREQSRRLMSERMESLGYIRMGKHEPKFREALEKKYPTAEPQYRIEKGGHHFDVYAGGILWELDEKEHQTHQDRIQKDLRYDTRAKELGYEVRHVWEWDFFESGIEKWHSLV